MNVIAVAKHAEATDMAFFLRYLGIPRWQVRCLNDVFSISTTFSGLSWLCTQKRRMHKHMTDFVLAVSLGIIVEPEKHHSSKVSRLFL